MLYDLSDVHQRLRENLHDWVQRRVAGLARRIELERQMPTELLRELAELGGFGIHLPVEQGGAGFDYLGYVLAVEELSRACASLGAIVTVHHLYCSAVSRHGTPEQHDRFLRPFASGESIGAFALTEPGVGSDAGSIRTCARRQGSDWLLNGAKSWITNSPIASAVVVFASVDPDKRHRGIAAFLVPLPSPGVIIGRPEDTIGMRGASSCPVIFEDCRVPAGDLLGGLGEGFEIAMTALNGSRLGMAAQAVGISAAALDLATGYAKDRTAFGQPIANFQAIQLKLADMAVRLRAARLLTYDAARVADRTGLVRELSAMAKVYASETATFAAHQAIQILGAAGCTADSPAERLYRDARITEIYAGTSEVMRLVIARELLDQGQVLRRQLYESAVRDRPAGRYSNALFRELMESEFSEHARNELALALLIIRVDDYPAIIAKQGRPVAEAVIEELRELLRGGALGANDAICLFGDGELAVLFKGASPDQAFIAATRVRRIVASHTFAEAAGGMHLHSSLGLACSNPRPHETPVSMVRAALDYVEMAQASGGDKLVTPRSRGPHRGTE